MRRLLAIAALLVALAGAPGVAWAADGVPIEMAMGWLVAAVIGVPGLLVAIVQTLRIRSRAAATERSIALDVAALHARAAAARQAGPPAALEFATAVETETARAQCGGCAASRAELVRVHEELAAERAASRAELRSNLERTLTSIGAVAVEMRSSVAVGTDQAAALRTLGETLRELGESLRGAA